MRNIFFSVKNTWQYTQQVFRLVSVALFLSVCSVMPVSAQRFHSIVVANTLDYDIGESVKTDMNAVGAELKRIAKYTGMSDGSHTLIQEDDFTLFKVSKAISELSVSEDDVVFFYYAGHGQQSTRRDDMFPSMNIDPATLDLSEVADRLKVKGGRLTVVIADCCNKALESNASGDLTASNRAEGTTDFENYKRLFMQVKGHIIATACKPNQYAYGTSKGGLFTQSLLTQLQTQIKSDIPAQWQKLLSSTFSETVSKAQRASLEQTPQYTATLNGITFSSIDTHSPANTLTPAEDDNSTGLSVGSISTILNKVVNSKEHIGKRMQYKDEALRQIPSASSIIVYIMNDGVQVEVEDAASFLERLAVSSNIHSLTVSNIEKAANGTIKSITVNEIYTSR